VKNSTLKSFIVVTGIGTVALAISAMLLMTPKLEAQIPMSPSNPAFINQERTGKYVLVYLDTMRLELRNGSTTEATFNLVSKGKPGSYYETPGGEFINDFKTELHFSSFGQVYLPYSVHIFGNFFIHGIPYYPNGERVSSSYSGGCIRLNDNDMKVVYDFVDRGTPIIIGNETPPFVSGESVSEDAVTRLMVGMISLEVLNQEIEMTVAGETKTRLLFLPYLLQGNTSVARMYAHAIGEQEFVALMNKRAQSIGLTNTTFTSVSNQAQTTKEDTVLFFTYLKTYKTYLLTRHAASL
jgi:hypothetical protein